MRHEASFLVLDSTMMLIATYLLTIFHPGIFFPQMRNGFRKSEADAAVDETREKPDETSPGESGNDTPRTTVV
jgi:hypothetical protein